MRYYSYISAHTNQFMLMTSAQEHEWVMNMHQQIMDTMTNKEILAETKKVEGLLNVRD